MKRFIGKVAVITGAAHGIGLAIARRYSAEGASVVLSDLNGEAAEQAADQINADGGTAYAVTCDVKSSEQISHLIDATIEKFGQIDILVNNAGDVTVLKHFLTTDEAWWDHFQDTNLKSQFLTIRKAAPIMARAGGGTIINMSSGGATRAHRGMVAYDASKGGVEGMTRALALELAPYKIRVNAIVPGLIASRPEHLEGPAAEVRDRTVPWGRGGTPEDLAGPAAFLASDDAAYMTGSTLVVDGAILVQQRSPQVEVFRVENYPSLDEIF
ncbi:SDR family NAD(P)-dependent oxidoreductase [Leucobacter sp. GX24907]